VFLVLVGEITLRILELLYRYFNKEPGRQKEMSELGEVALSNATMDLGVTWKDGMFYPSGAKTLDEKLIEDPIDWLDEFPDERHSINPQEVEAFLYLTGLLARLMIQSEKFDLVITYSIIQKSELEGTQRLDAEYYQPAYVRVANIVQSPASSKKIEEIAKVLRGKNPTKYTESGIPVIRAVDLRDITNWENILNSSDQENLFYLKYGDILVSSIGAGSIGKIQLFLETDKKVATVSEVSVIRTKNYSPFALAVFLMSKYGYLQLERRITGSTGQLHLYPKDIGTVLTPILNQRVQSRLEDMISASHKYLIQSKSLHLQAEQMLLDELELDKVDFSQSNCYSVSLSQAQKVNRVDAEYFQPKYDKLIEHLKKTGKAKLLGEITSYIKRGVQPTYVKDGEIIVINSQHLGRYILNIEATERTDYTFWEMNRRSCLQKGDVLLYSTRAYVGRTNVWFEDRRGIASNHVTIIRPREACNSFYLAVYLNAFSGLLQAEKWATGSGQREVYPEAISNFLVYLPSEEFQIEIANLITQSCDARKKAKVILGEAKELVERMIERETKREVG